MQKRISLKDIATKLGVSTALVSYVLNNKKEGRIGKEIAQKIRNTAEKLNYRPNQIAKSLKTSKTFTIGLIVADIANPFSSGLARIIEDEADKKGYTVIFGSSDENAQKFMKLVDSFINRQVDGLIILPPANSASMILQLRKQKIPFVIMDRSFPDIDTNTVMLDNYTAAYDAVLHLISSGYKRIGMIGYKTPLFHLQERERGYLSALKDSKIKSNKNWLKEVDISNDTAEIENTLHSLLSLEKPVDAVLLGSNLIAVAALRYIIEHSIKVPEDLAVVGFDETDIFDFFYAPLTYIKQPMREMGRTAIEILLENMEQTRKAKQVTMPAHLVIRKSTIK